MTEQRERTCHAKADHVPHPWDGGRAWCHGRGRFAALDAPTGVDPTQPCATTWTGPTGVIWDCVGHAHPSDPTLGYTGSGHTMVARQRHA